MEIIHNFKEGFIDLYLRLTVVVLSLPVPESGSSFPAIIRIYVVFPVPFSPSNTRISESENSPRSTSRLEMKRDKFIFLLNCQHVSEKFVQSGDIL